MSGIFDSKIFNEEVFGRYMEAVPNERVNKIRASKAIVGDKRLRSAFADKSQTGSCYALLPYFGLISGTAAQNYDGVSNLNPAATVTFEQGCFTYGRMAGWKEADFSYDITGGTDFTANIRKQITEYWNAVDQDVLLSILKGVFGMELTGSGALQNANAAFVEKHTYDISQSDVDAVTTAEMKMGISTLNSAIQQACGDQKNKFSLIFVHSAVSTNLENLNLLTALKYTDSKGIQRDLELGTWNGRLVIVDDTVPVEDKNVGATGGTVPIYTSYILGDGAIGLEDVGVKRPYEMSRDAKTRGGEDTLISRRRNAVSVAGVSYMKADQSTNSPTNTELENGLNWSLIHNTTNAIAHKTVPLARIISRG